MERHTHQKQVIMDVFDQLKHQHPTADAIYEKVLKLIPTISRATVYRILNQNAEHGVIVRIHMSAADRYDARKERHYHMHCKICGAIIDVDIPIMSDLLEEAPSPTEYLITDYDITFRGFCSKCYAQSAV